MWRLECRFSISGDLLPLTFISPPSYFRKFYCCSTMRVQSVIQITSVSERFYECGAALIYFHDLWWFGLMSERPLEFVFCVFSCSSACTESVCFQLLIVVCHWECGIWFLILHLPRSRAPKQTSKSIAQNPSKSAFFRDFERLPPMFFFQVLVRDFSK